MDIQKIEFDSEQMSLVRKHDRRLQVPGDIVT
jgi:hypothetical protein